VFYKARQLEGQMLIMLVTYSTNKIIAIYHLWWYSKRLPKTSAL